MTDEELRHNYLARKPETSTQLTVAAKLAAAFGYRDEHEMADAATRVVLRRARRH